MRIAAIPGEVDLVRVLERAAGEPLRLLVVAAPARDERPDRPAVREVDKILRAAELLALAGAPLGPVEIAQFEQHACRLDQRRREEPEISVRAMEVGYLLEQPERLVETALPAEHLRPVVSRRCEVHREPERLEPRHGLVGRREGVVEASLRGGDVRLQREAHMGIRWEGCRPLLDLLHREHPAHERPVADEHVGRPVLDDAGARSMQRRSVRSGDRVRRVAGVPGDHRPELPDSRLSAVVVPGDEALERGVRLLLDCAVRQVRVGPDARLQTCDPCVESQPLVLGLLERLDRTHAFVA